MFLTVYANPPRIAASCFSHQLPLGVMGTGIPASDEDLRTPVPRSLSRKLIAESACTYRSEPCLPTGRRTVMSTDKYCLIEDVLTGRMSRRDLIVKMLAAGVSLTAISGLLSETGLGGEAEAAEL